MDCKSIERKEMMRSRSFGNEDRNPRRLSAEGKERLRSKSFRYEDYKTRRVFLRSYPLHWGEDDDDENREEKVTITRASSTRKKSIIIRKIIISAYHWSGEKIVILRRFKDKLTVYVIACIPLRFKPYLLA